MTQILSTQSQYDSFTATRGHFHSNGLAMMPVAGAFPQSSVVVSLHGGMDYDVIVYTATRRGEPPVIPNPKVTNKNRVFLHGNRIGAFPVPDFMGAYGYAVSGYLLFGILSPEGLASDFMLGNLPFPGLDNNQYIPNTYFSYSLINQNQTQVLAQVPVLDATLQNMIAKG